MIRRFKIGYDVELHKRTVERGLLSLIGPTAQETCAGLTLADIEHANARVEIAGLQAILVRTDLGIDVICDGADTPAIAQALLTAGARPVAEAAAEIVRVEHGRPRYGIDLDDTVIPQEAGLNERAVSFTKGCYVGPGDRRAPALQGQAQPPPAWPAPVGGRRAGRGATSGRSRRGPTDQRRPLPDPRPDRPGPDSPRGRAGSDRLRRRARPQRRSGRATVSVPVSLP